MSGQAKMRVIAKCEIYQKVLPSLMITVKSFQRKLLQGFLAKKLRQFILQLLAIVQIQKGSGNCIK